MVTSTKIHRQHDSMGAVCKSYYQLTKPRIIPLLLITTAASMWIASEGRVDLPKLFITLLGGTLAAASAQTLNCIYDQDIDYEMLRTRARPIPAGKVQPRHALIFALVLGVLSFTLFAAFINVLSGCLALSGIVFYMLIYTHWLKRHTAQNIVIGGAAGSIPPLVGWAAVTGDLSWTPWVLFALIFLWTPPHFWALALMIKDDYAQVNVPMLPVIAGEEKTVSQIWYYSLLVVPFSLLLVYPLHQLGILYLAIAMVLGGQFLVKAWQLKQAPGDRDLARGLFKFSIFYLMLLCLAMVIDSLPVTHQLVAQMETLLLG
ncbi:protoheme IX farnesyltransferase [Synechocystis sp. FACHB-383]|uniref:heme o synthase n=2 Tax=Synechocystis TaxID=1142 RepID=UPI001685582D|nr:MULTISPECIES: heme o synthase [Synechocystis]MBD2652528.1 protoheme IX farnesyltransferase [Synechocystis sp. FACHB-383]MBE9203372.1 protoheme IX farnesyltransferase [Synechocystis salina LEGE 06099]